MKYLLPVFALLFLLNYSCKPSDDFDTGNDVILGFSLDTLRFDTVFTELGSATRILKVYNPKKKDIQISKISIKNDPTSFFKINVDGIPGNVATDIEIAGNDSLYIFAEVTIDPDQPLSNSPFVIEDYLVFEINGNTQEVLMEAWGQNAIYYPSRFSGGDQRIWDCSGSGGEFLITNDKPWVFYGTVAFANCNVRVQEGARIHVHGGFGVDVDQDNMEFFYNDGRLILIDGSSLIVEGTQDNPVIMTGDRLEEPFQEISGQWFGLLLLTNSSNHKIQYLELKNSNVGIYVDSLVDLNIENSKIYNTSNTGLIARRARVDATNCLFYNNSGGAVRFFQGGDYNFNYCTLASFGVDESALSMNNFRCVATNNIGQCVRCIDYRLNANFRNSIIFGSKKDEIAMVNGDECDQSVSSDMNYFFENCIVRVDELPEIEGFEDFFSFRCIPCQNADNNDAIFFDENENDFRLDTLSIAEGEANKDFKYPSLSPNAGLNVEIDLDGLDRDGNTPDVGCYEYQY